MFQLKNNKAIVCVGGGNLQVRDQIGCQCVSVSAWRDVAGVGMEVVRRLSLGEQRRHTVRGEVLAVDGVVNAHR